MWDTFRSARWTCWFNAWLDGHASSDEARDAVFGQDAAHDIVGLDTREPHSLLLAWGELRSRGATGARLALPQPGDLYGLGGPASFNEAALEAGEAVLVDGAGLGLVPQAVGQGVFWQVNPIEPAPAVDQVSDASRHLREELIQVAQQLSDLDVARWQPEFADALAGVRESAPDLAPGYGQRAARLSALAGRCLQICALAAEAESAAATAYEVRTVDEQLGRLSRVARHGLVAACSNGRER